MQLARFGLYAHCLILAAFASLLVNVALAEDTKILPVPNMTIYPGDTIRESSLADRDFSAGPTPPRGSVIETHNALVGKVARRTLLPGLPIPPNSVGEPRLVSNGEKVEIIFIDGGMTITTYGSALQAGGAGDVVSVRNLESGLTISGVVQPDGSVSVSGG
jgi:flagella basal body P-ring formation protein FlgA